MTRPEVADVFREFGPELFQRFGSVLSTQQRRTFYDITECRTASLGFHRRRCDGCDHEEVSYNSCRNRHCPKCQATKQREWLAREAANLIDVEYFHVVFTLPECVRPIALRNQRVVYGLLFKAAADAISTIARDPGHLGATPGFTAVLHTWGQTLGYHPHVHCVVPGGGLSRDGSTWVSCRSGYFLPVTVLSRRFRETFIRLLDQSRRGGALCFTGKTADLVVRWTAFLQTLREHEWVVYAKPPFGGPEQVLKYLAKYTHRVAISNARLIAIEGDRVRFGWKDYRCSRKKTMTLHGAEFVRRFLMHVLPPGFVRIRHFGFLANCVREARVQRIRKLLLPPAMPQLICALAEPRDSVVIQIDDPADNGDPICPQCKKGRLRVVEVSLPGRRSARPG